MKRQRSSVGGGAGSSATAAAPSAGACLENSVLAYVPTDDAALDCGVCYLPLKAPIFQCDVGHVICSRCRDKLAATGKCHVCGADTSAGHRRCHAMERVVESVRVPCPNAAYGCTATPAYCDQQRHLQEVCLHAPCHCPGEACVFAGTMEALLDHLAAAHGWQPSAAKVRNDEMTYVQLNDGFNFFVLDGGKQGDTTAAAAATTATAATSSRQFLLLLDVARQPLSCAISVLLIHPHAAASGDDHHPCFKRARCELTYSRSRSLGRLGYVTCARRDQVLDHDQKSKILVSCTDLSNGLPDPDNRFQFLVPNAVLTYKDKVNAINVGFKLKVDS